MELHEKIKSRKAAVSIIGLGYVGLPLAVNLAKAGYTVTGIDMQKDKVNRINRGDSYIGDVKSGDLKEMVIKKKLRASGDFSVINNIDVAVICVPTPLTKIRPRTYLMLKM